MHKAHNLNFLCFLCACLFNFHLSLSPVPGEIYSILLKVLQMNSILTLFYLCFTIILYNSTQIQHKCNTNTNIIRIFDYYISIRFKL